MNKILRSSILCVIAVSTLAVEAQIPLVGEPQNNNRDNSFIPLVGTPTIDKSMELRQQAIDYFYSQEYDKSADTLAELIIYLEQQGASLDERMDALILYISALGIAGRHKELYHVTSRLYDISPYPCILEQEVWDIVIKNAISSSIALGGTRLTDGLIDSACKYMDKSSEGYYDMLAEGFAYYLEHYNINRLRKMVLPVIDHVERYPEDVEMLADFMPFLSNTYIDDGALVRFRDCLIKAEKSGSIRVALMLYQMYMDEGKYKEAKNQIAIIDKYIKKASKALDKNDLSSFEDIMALINANNALNRFEDNIILHAKLEKALEHTPYLDRRIKEEIRLSLLPIKAGCYLFAGRYDEAKDIYASLLSKSDKGEISLDKTDLIMGLASVYEGSGDYDRAIIFLTHREKDASTDKDRQRILKELVSSLVEWLDSSYDHNSPLWKQRLAMLEDVISRLNEMKQKGITDVNTNLAIIGGEMSAAYLKGDMSTLTGIADMLPPYFKNLSQSSESRRYAMELYTMASVLSGDNIKAEQNLENLSGLALTREENLYNNMLLAEVASRKGEMDKARRAYSDLTSGIVNDLRDNLSRMTSEERANYFRKFANVLTNAGRMAEFGKQNKYAGEVYDLALFYKDFLLNSDDAIKRIIRRSGNANAIETLEDINRLERELSTELPNTKKGEKLRVEINQLQRTLWAQVPETKTFFDEMKADWQGVQNMLGNDEVAIEFLEWTPIAAPREYGAVVLNKDMKYPMVVRLGDAAEIEKEISASHKASSVWKSLLPLMNAGGKTYFSGAGLLNTFPIETLLVDTEGGTEPIYLKYPLYRLSSTRRLLESSDAQPGRLVIFGDIDYNNTDESASAANPAIASEISEKSAEGDVQRKIGKNISPLPGSKRELDNVISEFDSKKGKEALPFSDYNAYRRESASAGNFKKMSSQDANGLLVSTHGYYLRKNSDGKNDALSILSQDLNQRLRNSGLVMAGYNKYAKQQGDSQNRGVISAYDVAMLDLSNIDLAVLSACETGLGDAEATDSFGLQRGFKMAGVNTLVLTSAKVYDSAAEMMVSEFFHGLMQGLGKQEAFRAAQEKVRAKWPAPNAWTPFIIIDAL